MMDRQELRRVFFNLFGNSDKYRTSTASVNRNREKIELDPAHPVYIETVCGAGYRFPYFVKDFGALLLRVL